MPNSEPIISIVIPVYQAERFLTQCLDSILAQTLTNFEVICINDGSTDRSGAILDEFARRDARVIAIHQGNQGAGGSRNDGLAMARGKYTIFLDCDDYFEPTLLAELYKAIEREQADVAICRSTCFDDATGKPLSSEWMRKDHFLKGKTVFAPQEMGECLFQFTYGWAWDKLFRTEFLQGNEFTFPLLKNSEDLVFVYSAIATARRIVTIDDPLIYYRMNRRDSLSHGRVQESEAPWRAMELLKEYLYQNKVYQVYEQTFLNFTVDFCIWHISSLRSKTLQKEEYIRLQSILFQNYGMDIYGRSYYHKHKTYLKIKLIQYAPFWVYRTILIIYNAIVHNT